MLLYLPCVFLVQALKGRGARSDTSNLSSQFLQPRFLDDFCKQNDFPVDPYLAIARYITSGVDPLC